MYIINYMITNFKNYVGINLLFFLIAHTGEKFSLNELARKNNIAPRSAELCCKSFLEDGLLGKEIIGKSHLYQINEENNLIIQLKKLIFPYSLISKETENSFENFENRVISVYLYGSCAKGNFDKKSDVDIFVLLLNKEKTKDYTKLLDLFSGIILDREIQLAIYSSLDYRKNYNSAYLKEVKNGVKIYGEDL